MPTFLVLFFLIIKVFFLMYAKPLPDEAYYWLWSKNIALSYFDHPPLATWVLALLSSISDNKYFAIRASNRKFRTCTNDYDNMAELWLKGLITAYALRV